MPDTIRPMSVVEKLNGVYVEHRYGNYRILLVGYTLQDGFRWQAFCRTNMTIRLWQQPRTSEQVFALLDSGDLEIVEGEQS